MNSNALEFLNKNPTYAAYLEDFERAEAAYIRALCHLDSFRPDDDNRLYAMKMMWKTCDDLMVAGYHLMQAKAPDLAAVVFKMEWLFGYIEEVHDDDTVLCDLQRAIDSAKSGDALTAHRFAVPAIALIERGSREEKIPEWTILADLERLSC
jgi:hypothetical protein